LVTNLLCTPNLCIIGHGIINEDGELWKAQRKAGLAFLNTPTLRVLTDVALPQYLSQSIEHLKDKADSSVVDLQHVFHEITTQLMGKMAYNVSKRQYLSLQTEPELTDRP